MAAAILLIALPCCGCGRGQASPPPDPESVTPAESVVPAEATNLPPAVAEPVAPEPPPEASPSSVDTPERLAFREYQALLFTGNLPDARRRFERLMSELGNDAARDAFLDTVLPPASRFMLMLSMPCDSCVQGKCPACQGSRRCIGCDGERFCPACKGKPLPPRECTACRCPTCGGARICGQCRGRREELCPACTGTGTHGTTETRPCASCEGTGMREGLAGPYRERSVRCITCRGTGRVRAYIVSPCPVCKGAGQRDCQACKGTGWCHVCRGLGRIDKCKECGGTGVIHPTCQFCDGAGICQSCRGSGRCQACAGNGLCTRCEGSGLRERYRFVVDRDWLVLPGNYAVLDRRAPTLSQNGESVNDTVVRVGERDINIRVPEGFVLWIVPDGDFSLVRPSLFTGKLIP